jgi:hypothetical protein
MSKYCMKQLARTANRQCYNEDFINFRWRTHSLRCHIFYFDLYPRYIEMDSAIPEDSCSADKTVYMPGCQLHCITKYIQYL